MKPSQAFDRANTESIDVRANALLLADKPADAAQEFQVILNLKNASPADPAMSFAQLGLARSFFFALWKDADPDIPILKQAKAEYAKLQ